MSILLQAIKKRGRFSLLWVLAAITACSPLLDKPDATVLSSMLNEYSPPQALELKIEPDAVFNWSDFIDSPALDALITEALSNNYDLQASAARVRAAQQQARIASGRRWPTLDVGLEGRRDGVSPATSQHSVITESVSGVLSANWELDLWGGIALGATSSRNSALQQAEILRWSQFSLAAQVSKTWLDTLESKLQWQLSQQREKNLSDNLDIIERGFKNGFRAAVDVYSARAALANNQSNSLVRKQHYQALGRQLATLLGRYPNALVTLPTTMPSLSYGDIPTVLSLQLLARRPDLKAAAYAVTAQQASVAVAKANRLPSLNIRGSYGASSNSLHDVLSGDDIVWNIAAGLTAPIFRGGQLVAEQRRQRELLHAYIADYKQTALSALQEVEQSLENDSLLHERLTTATRAKLIAQQAEQQAFEAYTTGLSNLNTWLQAQRNANDRTSELIQIQASQLKNRIDLYLALGGNLGG